MTTSSSAFVVLDRIDGVEVDRCDSHDDALRVCEGLEPVLSREDGWRYVIEQVCNA